MGIFRGRYGNGTLDEIVCYFMRTILHLQESGIEKLPLENHFEEPIKHFLELAIELITEGEGPEVSGLILDTEYDILLSRGGVSRETAFSLQMIKELSQHIHYDSDYYGYLLSTCNLWGNMVFEYAARTLYPNLPEDIKRKYHIEDEIKHIPPEMIRLQDYQSIEDDQNRLFSGRTFMQKNTVKWIFFDVGSTLSDETEAYHHRIREAIAGTNITFEEFQEKRKFFAGQNLKGDLEAIRYFGLKETPWHKEDEVPYPDAEITLKSLREKGYRVGVIANQSPGTKERLESWGLLKYIEVVAASAEMGIAKPDRRIFQRALKMAGCEAHEAVMIGDRLDNDIYPAKKLGMQTIWVRQGFAVYQSPSGSEYEADYVVSDLRELLEIL